jgi:ribosomal protein L11 methyltransferase
MTAAVWRIAVRTTPEAEEAVAEVLSDLFQSPASSYTPLDADETVVSVFLAKKPRWSPATRRELRTRLRQVARCGLRAGRCTVAVARVRKWAESWKLHFKPIDTGLLLVKPSWSRRRPRPGQVEVVLDPGLAFGTGQHPTTAFCLDQLSALRRPGKSQSLLDLGTGSGILAIAAVKLGYHPVTAFDFDPEATRVARANARKNGVLARVRIVRRDLRKLPRARARRFQVICANLLADLLVSERDRILAHMHREGVLVMAGILKTEFRKVQRRYEAAGLRLRARRARKEWCSGSFTWKSTK